MCWAAVPGCRTATLPASCYRLCWRSMPRSMPVARPRSAPRSGRPASPPPKCSTALSPAWASRGGCATSASSKAICSGSPPTACSTTGPFPTRGPFMRLRRSCRSSSPCTEAEGEASLSTVLGDGGLPLTGDDNCFTVARPWWHRHTDGSQRLVAQGSELEACTQWYCQTDARTDIHDLCLAIVLAPHLTATGEEVPNFFDGAMNNCLRCVPRSQFEVSHPAMSELQQDPYV